MDTKSLGRMAIKSAAKGEVEAVFATFNEVDDDGDVTLPGAFDEADVPISAYGHSSWTHASGMGTSALPVGVGRIRVTDREAILSGQFFMDTTHGRDAFLTVDALHKAGLGQWSYGYDVVNGEPGEWNGRRVRFLKRLLVYEVSPTLVGVGVNTRTLAAKSGVPGGGDGGTGRASMSEFKSAIRPHETETYADEWDAAAVVAGLGPEASVSDLRSVFAWVDGGGDPEAKGSYKFPHHSKAGGPANVRACIAGIAALNGARGGTAIPDSDRAGVYAHLAGHLRDGDREPPELRAAGPGGTKTLSDVLGEALYVVSSALDEAIAVQAVRAQKGKSLSQVNVDLLQWLGDDMRRLRSVVDSPEEDMLREFAAYVARQHRLRSAG